MSRDSAAAAGVMRWRTPSLNCQRSRLNQIPSGPVPWPRRQLVRIIPPAPCLRGIGVITVYGGASMSAGQAQQAVLQGVGQYQYTLLSAAAQSQVMTDASNANAFFSGAGLPQVSAAQLLGQTYAQYMSNSGQLESQVYFEYPTGVYGTQKSRSAHSDLY